MFKNLKRKMVMLNMLIISVVMIISFIAIYFVTYNSIADSNQEKLYNFSKTNVLDLITPDPSRKPKGDNRYQSTFTIVVDKDFRIVSVSSYEDYDYQLYSEMVEMIESNPNEDTIKFDEKYLMYDVDDFKGLSLIDNRDEYYRISIIDITDSVNTLTTLILVLSMVGMLTLGAIFIISFYFAEKSVRPIENMWLKQKEFVANATHELKTPITIMSTNLEVAMMDEKSTIKKQKKWLDYLKTELSGMSILVNNLLESAKVEEENLIYQETNVSELVNNLLLSFETVAYEKELHVESEIEKNLKFKTDPNKLSQIVKIIYDNAIKYTNENGIIKTCVKKSKNKISISIENTGIGIPKDKLPHIFDRFYKVDEARTNVSHSYGLGLSIAKELSDKLGYKIYCKSEESKNTIFTIEMKVK